MDFTSLKSLKRKAETSLNEELSKKHKRIKRLENERETNQETHSVALAKLQVSLDKSYTQISDIARTLSSATTRVVSQDATIISLRSSLRDKQLALTATRNRLHASRRQTERAKSSLRTGKKAYADIRVWDPMENGQYHTTSRELARNLTFAGCSASKVAFVVESCARAFRIEIKRHFMSSRTVGRAIDEGGKYGELQLAREIMDAPGFVEHSDGTTHRGITVETRHVTLLVPSYDPDVDDSDKSTWRHCTRFVEVAPALDHTAERQFEGTKEVSERIADTYSRSPLSAQDKRKMDKNEYYRKKLGESKDHAADGKKEFKISEAHKKEIIIQDMGRTAMDEADLETSILLLTIAEITDEDLLAAGKLSPSELSSEKKTDLIGEVLEQKIGEEKFNSLTPDQQCNATTHCFGGCCMHKDLNVVRIGDAEMQEVYSTHNIPAPVLLANKANDATINLTPEDSTNAARQHAINSSSRGAVKLLQLIGALLRHKDGKRGYQDKCRIFMQERKLELYNLDESDGFPDVSNIRYGCYTQAAAEVVVFHGLIWELVSEVMDGKTKSGHPNHVEHLILKGLKCPATMEQLVAMALYGASVSWSYMAMVRGTKENPVNLLDLTDLHRKLPEFCTHIAENPDILLDPATPLEELTIDARPFVNELLIPTIRQLLPELPNVNLLISAMFSGAAKGWVRFTPEFHIGGTFDRLTPEQRAVLFIPSTNDCSEGMLGSYRVHMRYHPNSTTQSFTNQTRAERNNTEAFIKKCCDDAVEKFVMREVRKDGASGRRAKFRRAWAALQREKAESARKRREKAAGKKKNAEFRLLTTKLELNVAKIKTLSSKCLKEQLKVYKELIKDEVLVKMLWKNMATVSVRRTLVLEARERELKRR
ncbi:hypothetical protein C8R43DRAFT_907989 [Mycena crocata]|nr:hypothetical protein C8R43DRAFT_907989 [Mycena crocata]